MKDDFFDVPRTWTTTSCTRTQVPMFFYRIGLRVLNYFVDYDHVLPILKGPGWHRCGSSTARRSPPLLFSTTGR